MTWHCFNYGQLNILGVPLLLLGNLNLPGHFGILALDSDFACRRWNCSSIHNNLTMLAVHFKVLIAFWTGLTGREMRFLYHLGHQLVSTGSLLWRGEKKIRIAFLKLLAHFCISWDKQKSQLFHLVSCLREINFGTGSKICIYLYFGFTSIASIHLFDSILLCYKILNTAA